LNLQRISTLIWRHLVLLPQSLDRITDLFFWPLFDLIMWGLTSVWISQSTNSPQQHEVLLAVVSAAVFWRIMWSTSYEISSAFLEECWSRNLSNLVASPLSKTEWVVSAITLGALKLITLIAMLSCASLLLYDLSIFAMGISWFACFAILLCFGWSVAFFALGLILRFGIRAQALSWTLGFLAAPFSAIYFPLKMLPAWAQAIGLLFPTTHAFEGMRAVILEGRSPAHDFWIAGLLSILYLGGALLFLNRSFEKTRARGFDHLD
jgi:ABC-2 type transport system permease protein